MPTPFTVSLWNNIEKAIEKLISESFTEKNFNVGKYLDLETEFRTSELSGILLSVSEPNGFPALSLELYNGNVSGNNIFNSDTYFINKYNVSV